MDITTVALKVRGSAKRQRIGQRVGGIQGEWCARAVGPDNNGCWGRTNESGGPGCTQGCEESERARRIAESEVREVVQWGAKREAKWNQGSSVTSTLPSLREHWEEMKCRHDFGKRRSKRKLRGPSQHTVHPQALETQPDAEQHRP